MPRPPRHDRPAEGSREVVEEELARTRNRDSQESLDEKLDRAIELTFPASDPPLAGHPTGTEVPRANDTTKVQSSTAAGMAPGDEAAAGTPGTGEDICPMCRGHRQLNGSTCPHCAGRGRIIEGIGGA